MYGAKCEALVGVSCRVPVKRKIRRDAGMLQEEKKEQRNNRATNKIEHRIDLRWANT